MTTVVVLSGWSWPWLWPTVDAGEFDEWEWDARRVVGDFDRARVPVVCGTCDFERVWWVGDLDRDFDIVVKWDDEAAGDFDRVRGRVLVVCECPREVGDLDRDIDVVVEWEDE